MVGRVCETHVLASLLFHVPIRSLEYCCMSYIPPVSSYLSISVGGTLLFSVLCTHAPIYPPFEALEELEKSEERKEERKEGRKKERKEDLSPLLYFYIESIEQKQKQSKAIQPLESLCLTITAFN